MNLRTLFRLLLMVAIACAVAPAYAQKADIASPTSGVAAAGAANEAKIGELKERVKELEARERQNYSLEMEGQRKQVDWWLSFLGIMLAGLAIFVTVAGIAIPYVIARKNKEIFDLDKKVIEQDKAQVRQMKDEVAKLLDDAKRDTDRIHQHEANTADIAAQMQGYQSKAKSASESESGKAENLELNATVKTVQEDKTADPVLRLRAEAIAASEAEEADKAYALWSALTKLQPNDASAELNAGYWAHVCGNCSTGSDKSHWLKLAGTHYAQALGIKPDMHEAAYNWGTALVAEAQAVAATDLAAARGLWRQAGAQYQRALSIKPDKHEAADNWGNALLTEASAIAQHDPGRSRQLLVQAEQLLLEHANAAPGVVAYNLACVYGLRADVQSCLKWLKVAQEHKTLVSCEHIRNDKDLEPVCTDPAFTEWLNQVCPA